MITEHIVIFLIYCLINLSAASGGQAVVDYRSRSVASAGKRAGGLPTSCGKGASVICKNCIELVECTKTEDGVYTEEVLRNCSKTETCLKGTCTADPNSSCSVLNDVPFQCEQVGTFPDPADCKKYHSCNGNAVDGLVLYSYECLSDGSQDYGFNQKTLLCSTKLTNSKCVGLPVPLCRNKGDIGPLPGNPSYFYTCVIREKVLYPLQKICPYGGSFVSGRGCP